MGKPEAQVKIPSRYLTAQQAADYLAVSMRTLRTLLAKRAIPYVQVGGKGFMVRLDVRDLDSFMEKYKVHCV